MNEMAHVVPFEDLKPRNEVPVQNSLYPEFRYMGSKRRLLPWIHEIIGKLDFESVWDPFVGSGCVSYLFKTMGKRVVSSDFLDFPTSIARGLIANPGKRIDGKTMASLLNRRTCNHHFIEKTFHGVFYSKEDLKFLDRISGNIGLMDDIHLKSLAMAALLRSCLKKQPRGVFTITGDLSRYDDGRRDLRLTIEEHFYEQIETVNKAVFSNGKRNKAMRGDFFEVGKPRVDLIYLDPPYVPRSDDNCYVKRYHFLEGLSCYWQGLEIDLSTKSKKIKKLFTPFSYRRTAVEAFDTMFKRLNKQIIVLSYSSNGYPSLEILLELLEKYKSKVRVHKKPHRYHFGTHNKVKRAKTTEYLIIGE